MTEFTRELMFGKRPVHRTNPKPGQSECYFISEFIQFFFENCQNRDFFTEFCSKKGGHFFNKEMFINFIYTF